MSFQTNAYAGTCDCCRGRVPARRGRLFKSPRGWIVRHHDCAERRAMPAPRVVTAPPLAVAPGAATFDVWAAMGGEWFRQNAHARTHASARALAGDASRDGGWDRVVITPAGQAPKAAPVPRAAPRLVAYRG